MNTEPDFRCLHCRQYVITDPAYSGVQNRNHCPFCLWSKHLDLYKAGDRLAACKAKMKPVGLTVKQRQKRYAAGHGELMVVHLCTGCEKVSINRIAADDRADLLVELLGDGRGVGEETRAILEASGIRLLGSRETARTAAHVCGVAEEAARIAWAGSNDPAHDHAVGVDERTMHFCTGYR